MAIQMYDKQGNSKIVDNPQVDVINNNNNKEK